MNFVHDLPLRDDAGALRVVVEAPRGSHVKIKYDDRAGVFTWSRPLPLGVTFPYDFGFLPRTLADDDDALDAVIVADVASWPGVVVPARAVGALRVEQQRPGQPVKRNDRILVVPVNGHRQAHFRDIGDVAERILSEIEAFYRASLALTGKRVDLMGWADAAEAAELIDRAHAAYARGQPSGAGEGRT